MLCCVENKEILNPESSFARPPPRIAWGDSRWGHGKWLEVTVIKSYWRKRMDGPLMLATICEDFRVQGGINAGKAFGNLAHIYRIGCCVLCPLAYLYGRPLDVRCIPLRWRHNGGSSVSNHQPHDCLLNRLFRRRSKKTSKLRVTGLCAGNSPGTGEFPAQMTSNAKKVSIWWRHHA